MQPQIAVVLCLAQGTSLVTEGVYGANRFKYMDELRRMGAQVQVDGRVAVIEGVDHLNGAPVQACDLRAGAAHGHCGPCGPGRYRAEPGAVHRARLWTWWASSAPWARTSGWRRSPNPGRPRHTSADIAIPASAATRGRRRIFSAR